MLAPVRSDPASLKRLAVIDGLRGIAILLVLGFHLWGLLPGLSGTKATAALDVQRALVCGVGGAGVAFFLGWPGFRPAGTLSAARGSAPSSRSFYARRFLRVFPLYYVFLVILLFAIPPASALAGHLQI